MLKKIVSIAVLAVCSLPAWADDFDVTMDVVGMDETIDEAIVNRIALPFAVSDTGRSKHAQDGLAYGAAADELEQLVETQLDSAGVEHGGGMDIVEGLDVEEVQRETGVQIGLPGQ